MRSEALRLFPLCCCTMWSALRFMVCPICPCGCNNWIRWCGTAFSFYLGASPTPFLLCCSDSPFTFKRTIRRSRERISGCVLRGGCFGSCFLVLCCCNPFCGYVLLWLWDNPICPCLSRFICLFTRAWARF